jgi:hypothetical protein
VNHFLKDDFEWLKIMLQYSNLNFSNHIQCFEKNSTWVWSGLEPLYSIYIGSSRVGKFTQNLSHKKVRTHFTYQTIKLYLCSSMRHVTCGTSIKPYNSSYSWRFELKIYPTIIFLAMYHNTQIYNDTKSYKDLYLCRMWHVA